MIIFGNKVLHFEYFPNGETKMLEAEILERCYTGANGVVTLKYEDDGDLIRLMFLKKFLDRQGYNCTLVITYMPYSRMDRSEKGSAFTLKYVTDFINSLEFDGIVVIEPHSDVTMALLNNVEATYPTLLLLGQVMAEIGFNANEDDYLFFPDAGAQKRYTKFLKDIPSAVGIKTRDFATGTISKFITTGFGPHTQPRKVIIVDDLCSRGGTFLEAGNAIRAEGAEEIYLLVTHCEHNILTGKLFNADSPITKVFATDTIINWNDVPNYLEDRLHIFKEIGVSSGE